MAVRVCPISFAVFYAFNIGYYVGWICDFLKISFDFFRFSFYFALILGGYIGDIRATWPQRNLTDFPKF